MVDEVTGEHPRAHVKNQRHAGGNSISHLSLPAEVEQGHCMSLNLRGFSVWTARPQILEQVLPLGVIQRSPRTLLIELPSHVAECRRACVRSWIPGKKAKSPILMLGVPHQLMLEDVRLEHRDLQSAADVPHESNA